MIGKSISHYKILEKLGEGGMGVVYKAEDLDLKRDVAIKFLPRQIAASDEERARFKIEAQAAAALNHPNIATIFAIEEHDDEMFIVMEYIEGRELREIVHEIPLGPPLKKGEEKQSPPLVKGGQGGFLPLDDILNYASQIAAGLQAAHNKGVTHRDIKSANIMITETGQVKIMDFGLAKIGGGAQLTKSGMTLGTAAYMSPEQMQGLDTDHRTDIWAFGVVLYEMLTGELPFKGDYEQALMYSIMNEEPADLTDLRDDVPRELSEILGKTLQKEVDNRYQSTKDVLAELKKVPTKLTGESTKKEETKIPSIAVLPFVNMSADPENEYFSDGLAEDIINSLTKLKNFRVAARTSTFSFKGKNTHIRQIGNELNVNTVLEGSVRKAGNRLHITAQLIHVDDGYHVWSEQYNRVMEDVFAIQDEITLAIVEKLQVELLGKDEEALVKRYTDNLDAYNLYLKGRYFWSSRHKGGLQKALDYFQQAIAEDPDYALGYTGIADCYQILGLLGFLDPKVAAKETKKAAQKAMKLDASLAEPHATLGFCKTLYNYDPVAGEEGFRRFFNLGQPTYGDVHVWHVSALAVQGKFHQAEKEIERAIELEPLSLVVNAVSGIEYYLMDAKSKALKQLNQTVAMDPDYLLGQFYSGWAFLGMQRVEEALRALQKAATISSEAPLFLGFLGAAYAMAGRVEEARDLITRLQKLSESRYVSPYSHALIFLGLDEKDLAFEWLEKARLAGEPWLVMIGIDPLFDKLRSDGRFAELLQKMGLKDVR